MPLLFLEFLGTTELMVIALVALIIFGPRKLPELGRSLGKSLGEFKRASEDFKRTWEREVEVEKIEREIRIEEVARMEPRGLTEAEVSVVPPASYEATDDDSAGTPLRESPAGTINNTVARDSATAPSSLPTSRATADAGVAETEAVAEPSPKHDWL